MQEYYSLTIRTSPPISIDKKKPFIPASTTKLITAWLALNHWGEEHHFRTDFYFDTQSNTLWIKGSGDPFLVSEELLIIAEKSKHYQRPANFVDAQAYMQDTLKNQFNWQDFTLKEGAGLSRDNRLSAEQLVELLNKFRAWKHLLPEVTAGVYAKSGTLNKVSTLAGYTIDKQHHWNAFALMMTQSVPSRRRNFIIRELADR